MKFLDDGIDQSVSVILVSAPAGYGKTTVISDWINRSATIDNNYAIRLTIEKNDDYLVGFLTYFISAIQRILVYLKQ